MSPEASNIVFRVVNDLNGCKYFYSSIVNGAIETCINVLGMPKPRETTEEMAKAVIDVFSYYD